MTHLSVLTIPHPSNQFSILQLAMSFSKFQHPFHIYMYIYLPSSTSTILFLTPCSLDIDTHKVVLFTTIIKVSGRFKSQQCQQNPHQICKSCESKYVKAPQWHNSCCGQENQFCFHFLKPLKFLLPTKI